MFHVNGIIYYVGFFVTGLFHLTVLSRFIHTVACISTSFLYCWILFHCIDISHFVFPFFRWWTFGQVILNIAFYNNCIKMEVKSTHVTPLPRNYQWLPITLSKSQSPYSDLQGPTCSACTLPSLFQSSHTGLPVILHTCQAYSLQQGLYTFCPFSLWLPCPWYLHDLLPHFPQIFT